MTEVDQLCMLEASLGFDSGPTWVQLRFQPYRVKNSIGDPGTRA